MPTPRVAAALALRSAHDRDGAVLIEAKQLRQAQLEARGDAVGDGEGGTRLPALDLREHRRADPAALGEIAQRQRGRLPQRSHARPDHARIEGLEGAGAARLLAGADHTAVCYHVRARATATDSART